LYWIIVKSVYILELYSATLLGKNWYKLNETH